MTTKEEILAIEEELRRAELGPDPDFFARALDDDALIDGLRVKAKIVEAHRPGSAQSFTSVKISDFNVVDHGDVAVVTCTETFEGPKWSGTLKFMRVWQKQPEGWKIIAAASLK